MPKPNLIIHIGYPKTGTTTFQNHLFPKHSEINFIINKQEPFSNIIHSLYFDRENAVWRNLEYFKDILSNEIEKHDKHKLYVFSSESLTSFSMFFRFSPSPYVWAIEPNSIARKLHTIFCKSEMFDSVKILMSIRLQSDILKSMYAQVYNLVFKRFKETKNFQRFLNYALEENTNQFIVDALQYNEVVATYENLFGKDNVCVQPYEKLRSCPYSYFQKISEFMHVNSTEAINVCENKIENKRSGNAGYYPSDSRSLVELLSFYKNRYLGNKFSGIGRSKPMQKLKTIHVPGKKLKDVDIPDYYQSKIEDLFTESNMKLSSRRNLNLGKYGYFYNNLNP